MITLNEAKNYLRVDHEEDDKLILQLLDTAKSLVKDVGRMDEEKFTCDENSGIIRSRIFIRESLQTRLPRLNHEPAFHSVCTARGCGVMDFDKLNQRIAILEHRTVVDEIGNHTSKWDEVFSCWAKVSVKSSAEQVNAGVTREIQSVSFVVRQSLFILSLNSTTHRILFRGLTYNIKSVQRDYLHNSYITLVCEVRKAGCTDEYN